MPLARMIAEKVGRAITKSYDFDEDGTRVMDFACGSGLLSRVLAAHCASITGADINPAVVARYNARAAQQGLSPAEMSAILVSDLPEPNPAESEEGMFDVVACSMAFHHIKDINAAVRELANRIHPGGALFVADLLHDALEIGSSSSSSAPRGRLLHVGGPIHLHAPGSNVEHPDGFTREEVLVAFQNVGLEDVTMDVVHSVDGGLGVWEVFLASGWKPDSSHESDD
ncbi:S-adenosyl-L-methionine-dependent methyltransferase [Auriculariales sp. MPI-PUGE-AT-0066]|nr:S-adenosyl-L-methionine-dependent methyltransferase [Auriculariales sp. MPI-PUGE-AT-0066]